MSENNFDVWILVNKSGETYMTPQGHIALFKSSFTAAMFVRYELKLEEEWSFKEIIADESLFSDSYVNFIG